MPGIYLFCDISANHLVSAGLDAFITIPDYFESVGHPASLHKDS